MTSDKNNECTTPSKALVVSCIVTGLLVGGVGAYTRAGDIPVILRTIDALLTGVVYSMGAMSGALHLPPRIAYLSPITVATLAGGLYFYNAQNSKE